MEDQQYHRRRRQELVKSQQLLRSRLYGLGGQSGGLAQDAPCRSSCS